MKLFACLAFLSVSAAAAPMPTFVNDAIYMGKAVAPDGQGWKSAVALSFESTDGGYYACTGVFVDSDVILTAAHCKIKNKGQVTVRLFRQNNEDSVSFDLEGDGYRYYANPRYRKSNDYEPGTDDMGILVLRDERIPDDFETADFVSSDMEHATDMGQSAYVIGAGRKANGQMSEKLYFAQGPISSYLNGSLMVVRFTNGMGICGGDSGGPVFVKSGGHLYLWALTSSVAADLGGECGDTLYTNVITNDRYQWILSRAEEARTEMKATK